MQSYAGKTVTVTGTIGQVVSPNAYTVAIQGNTSGGSLGGNANNANNAQTLLAVAKQTTGTPTPGSPIQVTGVLQPTFDPNQAQASTGINFDRAALTPYNGKPYVEAAYAGPISANLTNSGQAGGLASTSSTECATASRILDNPQSYAGQQVTVTGTIAQIIGAHGVTIVPTGSTNNATNAQTLLAVAQDVAKDNMPMNPGAPVQVTGTLQPTFDISQATTFAGGNLDPRTYTAYQGKPYVQGGNLDPTAFRPYNGKPYVQAVYVGPASVNLSGGQNGR
jgi:hypothetical protein